MRDDADPKYLPARNCVARNTRYRLYGLNDAHDMNGKPRPRPSNMCATVDVLAKSETKFDCRDEKRSKGRSQPVAETPAVQRRALDGQMLNGEGRLYLRYSRVAFTSEYIHQK
jgi:hypothetical protein